MKAAIVLMVDGGYFVFSREVDVTEVDVAFGKFTTGAETYDAWKIVRDTIDGFTTPRPAIMPTPVPAPTKDDDIPF